MWKEFFYYRRGERIAVMILFFLIVLAAWFVHFIDKYPDDQRFITLQTDTIFIRTCDSFYLSLHKQSAHRPTFLKPERELFFFDPNQLDSAAFVRLGLPFYVARNIIRYRAKGGVFRTSEQFSHIYGLDSADFNLLSPFIRIDTSRLPKPYLKYERDSLKLNYPQKYTEITQIELNSADTALLMKIPGIGQGFAAMVVNYREQLGGFYSFRQLGEIKGVNDSLLTQWEPWFTVDRSLLRPISVNKASLSRLRNHPYLNFYQAKVICELRKQYKRIEGMEDFALLEEFQDTDFEALKHYLDFQ